MVRISTRSAIARSRLGAPPAPLLLHRASARVVGGAQCDDISIYRPGVSISRRCHTHHLPHRVPRAALEDMPGRYACSSPSRSDLAFLAPSGTAALMEGARTPNAPPQLRRHCRARQVAARESCEKRAQVQGRASGVSCRRLFGAQELLAY